MTLTATAQSTANIPDGNIIDVLLAADFKGIIVSPWDPKVIRKFRTRLAALMNDSHLGLVEAYNTHSRDIATDLCREEHDRIPPKDRAWLASLGIRNSRQE